MRRVDSGSVCSPRLVELTMSAKRTVTVFRTSPDGAAAAVSGVAQFRQNRARSGFSSPQAEHRTMRAVYERRSPSKEEARRCAGLLVWDLRRLVAGALRAEAVAAVNGLGAGRAERNQGLLAAVGAGGAEHLARAAVVAAATGVATARVVAARVARAAVAGATAGRLADCTAGGAATRLAELPIGVELLLARREGKVLATVGAVQRLVGHC